MKIISQIPGNRVLVNITEQELAHLLGQPSPYDIKKDFYETAIKAGNDIEISEIYKKHINIIHSQGKFNDVLNNLEAMKNIFTPIQDQVTILTELSKIK